MTRAEREEVAALIGGAQGLAVKLNQIGDRLLALADAEVLARKRGGAAKRTANSLREVAARLQDAAFYIEDIPAAPFSR